MKKYALAVATNLMQDNRKIYFSLLSPTLSLSLAFHTHSLSLACHTHTHSLSLFRALSLSQDLESQSNKAKWKCLASHMDLQAR